MMEHYGCGLLNFMSATMNFNSDNGMDLLENHK